MGYRVGENISKYFVAGGIYKNQEGGEWFTLVCPGSGELPYVMEEGMKPYFKLIWQNAHLYQVEEDYTLSLVALSREALQRGVEAPERVTPDSELSKKLQTVLKGLTT